MTTLKITDKAAATDPLVIAISQRENRKIKIESGHASVDEKAVLAALETLGATASAEEVIKFPLGTRLIVTTGLGKSQSSFPHEVLRRAAGAAARSLAGNTSASFSLPASHISEVAAIAEGAALGAYDFAEFRYSSKVDRKYVLQTISIISPLHKDAAAKKALIRAGKIAEYTYFVRDLINTSLTAASIAT